jgi:hypothetical protein
VVYFNFFTFEPMKKLFYSFLILSFPHFAFSDEGMWMPNQLKKKEADMKERGLNIPVEEIYSESNVSLKDAVVLFGGGCTGEIISNQGLVLTNHHCGFSQIQSHSSLEHNYVENGFWAKDKSQEIPCPGLTVTFVVRIENVTEQIFSEVKPEMSQQERDKKIAEVSIQLEKKSVKEKWQQAKVKPFYYGNEYYLYVTETFRDIRFVGAPPASIGRFGGDADNWMWPRHTGDFSLFRIYADSANHPADYSEKNFPYKPKKSFTLCAKGIHEGDFTMVFGFPGKTTEYIPSFAVDLVQNVSDPARVNIRDRRLTIWRDRMNRNDTIKLKYASKYGTIANYWKKWDGEMQGLRRSNVISEKQDEEKEFIQWTGADGKRRDEYAGMLHEMELFYGEIKPVSKLYDYYNEAILGTELLAFLNNSIRPLAEMTASDSIPDDSLQSAASKLMKGVPGFFKNYDARTDELILASMLQLYHDSLEEKYRPEIYSVIASKYKGDYRKYARMIFRKSIFADENKLSGFLKSFGHSSAKKLKKDPAWKVYQSFFNLVNSKGMEQMTAFNIRIASLQHRYMKAQMEMKGGEKLYPDANLTLRVTYGQVKGYSPRDAVHYGYQSTLTGVMEKYIPDDPDFNVPAKLRELYDSKDFGSYALNGDVPVAFIANNHTTGGNSGSPVINADGELIGTNFDRTWEGTLSDIQYDVNLCRNIALDIRYTLFIIEKVGGAKHIIDELQISR